MEATIEVPSEQIAQVTIPLCIRNIIREVAEANGLDRFQFVPNRQDDPSSAPLFHYLGRSDARISMSGADSSLSIADMTQTLEGACHE